jgi:type I restriction enzyme, S subunit
MPVLLPAIAEQVAIAFFLDRETAKIDALVDEQKRLIELLKEKRQAVISHAVSKGLDAAAPMKDSGVEWIGQVPEHWVVTPLKHVAVMKGRLGWQGLRADEYSEEGPYLVTSEHFSNDKVDWHRCHHVLQERYDLAPEIQLRREDLLLMKDGAAMGKLAYIEELPGPACLNSHLLLIRPRESRFLNRFLYYVLSSQGFKAYIVLERTGTTFFGISQESMGAFPFAMPPVAEQEKVVALLEEQLTEVDSLATEAETAIKLLRERRSALISAAVAGKIDVREATLKAEAA